MHIRYVYTNEQGREASRPVYGDMVPPIGATVAEYLVRPSDNRPQPAKWKLRVVGAPEVQYIGRSEVWLVPCEVVSE